MSFLRKILLWLGFTSLSLMVRCGLPPPSAWRFSLLLCFHTFVRSDLLQLFRDESRLLLLLLLGLLPRLPSLCVGVWSCSPRRVACVGVLLGLLWGLVCSPCSGLLRLYCAESIGLVGG